MVYLKLTYLDRLRVDEIRHHGVLGTSEFQKTILIDSLDFTDEILKFIGTDKLLPPRKALSAILNNNTRCLSYSLELCFNIFGANTSDLENMLLTFKNPRIKNRFDPSYLKNININTDAWFKWIASNVYSSKRGFDILDIILPYIDIHSKNLHEFMCTYNKCISVSDIHMYLKMKNCDKSDVWKYLESSLINEDEYGVYICSILLDDFDDFILSYVMSVKRCVFALNHSYIKPDQRTLVHSWLNNMECYKTIIEWCDTANISIDTFVVETLGELHPSDISCLFVSNIYMLIPFLAKYNHFDEYSLSDKKNCNNIIRYVNELDVEWNNPILINTTHADFIKKMNSPNSLNSLMTNPKLTYLDRLRVDEIRHHGVSGTSKFQKILLIDSLDFTDEILKFIGTNRLLSPRKALAAVLGNNTRCLAYSLKMCFDIFGADIDDLKIILMSFSGTHTPLWFNKSYMKDINISMCPREWLFWTVRNIDYLSPKEENLDVYEPYLKSVTERDIMTIFRRTPPVQPNDISKLLLYHHFNLPLIDDKYIESCLELFFYFRCVRGIDICIPFLRYPEKIILEYVNLSDCWIFALEHNYIWFTSYMMIYCWLQAHKYYDDVIEWGHHNNMQMDTFTLEVIKELPCDEDYFFLWNNDISNVYMLVNYLHSKKRVGSTKNCNDILRYIEETKSDTTFENTTHHDFNEWLNNRKK